MRDELVEDIPYSTFNFYCAFVVEALVSMVYERVGLWPCLSTPRRKVTSWVDQTKESSNKSNEVIQVFICVIPPVIDEFGSRVDSSHGIIIRCM